MTDRESLIAGVIARPDDDTPRLVFADWCDENGDPGRAEFVRVQISLTRLDNRGPLSPIEHALVKLRGGKEPRTLKQTADSLRVSVGRVRSVEGKAVRKLGFKPSTLRRRERELLATGWHDWRPVISAARYVCANLDGDPLINWLPGDVGVRFEKGFVSELKVSAADWLAHGDAVRAEHPVRKVVITEWTPMGQTAPQWGLVWRAHALKWFGHTLAVRDEWQNRHMWADGDPYVGPVLPAEERRRLQDEFVRDAIRLRWPGVEFEMPPDRAGDGFENMRAAGERAAYQREEEFMRRFLEPTG